MKKSIMIMIALMIVISSSAVFALCPDPSILDNKNNPGCPDFELTADNVKDVPNDKVAALPANKLTPEVLGAMKDEQIQALSTAQLSDHSVARNIPSDKLIMLTSSQLSNENVLLALSGVPGTPAAPEGSRIKDLNPNAFKDAFNKVYPAPDNIALKEANSLSGVSMEQLTGGRTFIVDSNGNKFDISGKGSIVIDEHGVVHTFGPDSRIPVVTKNGEYTLTGIGTVDKDGKFSCSENEYCSVEGDNVLIDVGGREVNIKGNISIDTNGNIVELKGELLDDYLDEPLVLGDEEGAHYTISANISTKIEWSQAGSDPLKATFAGGSGDVSYYDGLTKKAYIAGTSGAAAEIRGTDYASLKDCSTAVSSLACSYANYDKNEMNGLDLPDRGYLLMQTGKGGSFSFSSGTLDLAGNNADMTVRDNNDNILMGVDNIDSGSTKVVLGDYSATEQDKEASNIVLLKSTKEAEFYTKDSSKVGIRMNNPEGTSQTQVITDAGGVKGTISLKGEKAGAYPYPDVSVSALNKMPAESTSPETLATVKVNEDSVSVTRQASGNVDLAADRRNSNDQRYVISTSNLGNENKGEVIYSNGQDSVLLGFNKGKYDLRSMESGFGLSLNDDEKDKVKKVLSDMGMLPKDIAGIQRFGRDLFTSNEQTTIFASAKETITAAAEEAKAKAAAEAAAKTKEEIVFDVVAEKIGLLPPAEAKPIPGEAAAATVPPEGKLFSDEDKNFLRNNVKPGSVNGHYYQDDNGVKAMLKSLGYEGPDAVTRFQVEAGIKVDGYVGVQTSSALLIACKNTGKCNDNNLNTFKTEVISSVYPAAIAAADKGNAQVNAATPAPLKSGDRRTTTGGTSGTVTSSKGKPSPSTPAATPAATTPAAATAPTAALPHCNPNTEILIGGACFPSKPPAKAKDEVKVGGTTYNCLAAPHVCAVQRSREADKIAEQKAILGCTPGMSSPGCPAE